MSKKSKSEARKRRRSQKSARKAAQQALYESRVRAGQNSKSKRSKLRSKNERKVRNARHLAGPCSNVGCSTCNPAPYNLLPPSQYRLLLDRAPPAPRHAVERGRGEALSASGGGG